MIVYFFLSGLVLLLLGKWCSQIGRARRVCREFKAFAAENEAYLTDIVKQVKAGNDFRVEKQIVNAQEDVFMIEENNGNLTIHALNNEKKRHLTKRQYNRLMRRLRKRGFVCSFDIDTVFLYYKYDVPYENFILWIGCKSDRIF